MGNRVGILETVRNRYLAWKRAKVIYGRKEYHSTCWTR